MTRTACCFVLALSISCGRGGLAPARRLDRAVIDEVNRHGKALVALQDAIFTARDRNASAFDQTLTGLELREPDPRILGAPGVSSLDAELQVDLVRFVHDLGRVRSLVDQLVRESKQWATMGARRPHDTRYGVVLRAPANDPPFAELVALGRVVCKDRKPHTEGCQDGPPVGFEYRDTHDSPWAVKDWGIEPDQILPVRPTEILVELGNADLHVAEKLYFRRFAELAATVDALIELRRSLVQRLEAAAAR